jgi:hypothetical protein
MPTYTSTWLALSRVWPSITYCIHSPAGIASISCACPICVLLSSNQ